MSSSSSRLIIDEIDTNITITPSKSTNPSKRGRHNKTFEQRAETWVLPPPVDRPVQHRTTETKRKVIMFHDCHRIPVYDLETLQISRYRPPTIEEMSIYFKIPRSTINGWIHKRDTILGSKRDARGVQRHYKPHWPDLEDQLHKSFLEARALGKPIRQEWFEHHSRRLWKEANPECESLFTFSEGWFKGFCKRKEISLRYITHTVSDGCD
ncbi:hypothetical protein BELL_0436g00060 [Botrytis elliptica]|uniref:HTH CENPB-type domain-containing protein n=1 Tax=Botrytis elliptica TaxID=278938 RepID=A0A4Z1JGZ4_9HELO|nr:hypothetical protein EAE99_008883 [Botrytis elliptica]TGO72604.1 hypothetical protein BELL_0436g00060 [Botrytis elliptica]